MPRCPAGPGRAARSRYGGPGTHRVPGPLYAVSPDGVVRRGPSGRLTATIGRDPRLSDETRKAVAGVLVEGFGTILGWVQLALTVYAVLAFADAAVRREDAYRAADKKTKPFWLIVLGLSALATYFMPLLSFLPVIAMIAVVVYTVDVRPALRAITGGGGRRAGGSSSDGPYGPFNGR